MHAPLTQLDRVSDFESESRGFESLRVCHRTEIIGVCRISCKHLLFVLQLLVIYKEH